MPTIAQQDYLRLISRGSRQATEEANSDAAFNAALLKNIEAHTIFDTIMEFEATKDVARVLGYVKNDNGIVILYGSASNESTDAILLDYSQTQYEGLAAIQAEQAPEGYAQLPSLITTNGYLYDDSVNGMYVCVGGKYLEVTTDSNQKIASLAISDESAAPDSYIDITWEDAQKLIGLSV